MARARARAIELRYVVLPCTQPYCISLLLCLIIHIQKMLKKLSLAVLIFAFLASTAMGEGVVIGFERASYSALERGSYQVCLVADFGVAIGDGNVTLQRTYEVGKLPSQPLLVERLSTAGFHPAIE